LDLLRLKLDGLARPALRKRVEQAEAIRLLESVHPLNILARFRRGPLLRLALIQMPYRVFRITVPKRGPQYLAFDTFSGALDPYSIEHSSEFEESAASDRNHLPSRLSAQDILESARSRYQRIRFQEGFFRHGNDLTEFSSDWVDIFVPYWVGFTGDRQQPRVVVLDAVRRSQEGSRLRHVLASWLAAKGVEQERSTRSRLDPGA
jgi:hypothetical protein